MGRRDTAHSEPPRVPLEAYKRLSISLGKGKSKRATLGSVLLGPDSPCGGVKLLCATQSSTCNSLVIVGMGKTSLINGVLFFEGYN